MKKPWFLKGRTGEALTGIREEYAKPFTISAGNSVALIHADGMVLIGLTVRGNARNRRHMARQLGRWLNGERP